MFVCSFVRSSVCAYISERGRKYAETHTQTPNDSAMPCHAIPWTPIPYHSTHTTCTILFRSLLLALSHSVLVVLPKAGTAPGHSRLVPTVRIWSAATARRGQSLLEVPPLRSARVRHNNKVPPWTGPSHRFVVSLTAAPTWDPSFSVSSFMTASEAAMAVSIWTTETTLVCSHRSRHCDPSWPMKASS